MPRWTGGAFLMTPTQHRRQAALLRKAGNLEHAKNHDNLAKLIEGRARTGVVTCGGIVYVAESPPLAPR
jgi:hypothetical protein